jgi:GAF domain-containing protein
VEPVPETREVLDELISQGDGEIGTTLMAMGRRAREIVPECVGLSLALLEDGLTFTLVATSTEIAALDAVQYLDGGPCVEAAHEQKTLDVDQSDMVSENKWRLYAQATAAAGVASSLTLPVERGDRVVGSINLYAATPDAFNGRHDELGEALGASALSAVANADLSFSTRLEAVQAPARLADQDDVDVALGIIAASQDIDIAMAHQRLRQAAARAGITEGQAARAVRQVFSSHSE